jgi:hypothetical protein
MTALAAEDFCRQVTSSVWLRSGAYLIASSAGLPTCDMVLGDASCLTHPTPTATCSSGANTAGMPSSTANPTSSMPQLFLQLALGRVEDWRGVP